MSQDIQDRLGPVDVVIVEFPAGTLEAAGFEALLDAVNKGVVRVLDIELVSHGTDGSVTLVDLDEAAAGFGLTELVGASSGILDADDVAFIGEITAPGSLSAAILYEQIWVFPVVDGFESVGGRVVSSSHLDAQDVVAALGDE